MLVPPSADHRFARTLLLGSLAASLIGVLVGGAALATRPPAEDPCKPSFDIGALPPHDRGLIARRALACADLGHGRITADEYRLQTAAIDRAWTPPPAPPAPPALQWASQVRGFSTQYTAQSWAADRVLGAPDVFPANGDNSNAWASLGADDKDEWIEVGYAQPTRISAVEVFETFNPGAISAIELVTASGQRITAYQGSPAARGQAANKLHADVACTDEPIVAVNVRLASTKVAGWNELDAIGVQPCSE